MKRTLKEVLYRRCRIVVLKPGEDKRGRFHVLAYGDTANNSAGKLMPRAYVFSSVMDAKRFIDREHDA